MIQELAQLICCKTTVANGSQELANSSARCYVEFILELPGSVVGQLLVANPPSIAHAAAGGTTDY